MSETPKVLGFLGLGDMGGPMAANLMKAGLPLHVFDIAGTAARAPEGAVAEESVAAVAQAADTIFLSLPDGPVVEALAHELAALTERRVATVVDLSTVGPAAARAVHATLGQAGILYVDAPVSGGRAGAIAGSISLMWAGPEASFAAHREIVAPMAKGVFHVGLEPGQGQALKLLNNFLSATALTATSEAIAFGVAQGLDMQLICDVLNVSSGVNSATKDKFPNRIIPGSYAAGFRTRLMTKDVTLYLENVRHAGTPVVLAERIADIWRGCDGALPGSDFTEIYPYLTTGKGKDG